MIVTFIGHSSIFIDNTLSNKIKNTIFENIKGEKSVIFYCGGYGEFDRHCACVCKSLKGEIPNCELVLVTPYIVANHFNETMKLGVYDTILYPPIEQVHPRFAIIKRNEWVVSKSDLIIAYVSHPYGGAYRSFQYAQKRNKKIINLANF